ncbi:MAG: hypothetical protein DDT32_00279 [Syntrophomonadaceae bacterium]|nr:hypothetical protein [Bacillota bacterium]
MFTATRTHTENVIPKPVHLEHYADPDITLARLLGGWRALTVEQYRCLGERLDELPGRNRVPKLIKCGFLTRHELLDGNGKRLCGYYLPGRAATNLCGLPNPPELDLTLTVSVLMCNQLIISGLFANWGVRRIFDIGVGRIPCWITRRGQSYGVLPLFDSPHSVVTALSRATRGLLIVPDEDAAISFSRIAPIPVRYLLWPDLLNWQISLYKVVNGKLIPATISFANEPLILEHAQC